MVTYPGDVWSFTTQEFAVVDDFESYNDDKNRICDTWIDGLGGNGTSTWAKGGVMIRVSLKGGSTFADMTLSDNSDGTASGGYSFQRRLTTDGPLCLLGPEPPFRAHQTRDGLDVVR